ncbi:MAG: sodium-dependent transporter [Emergencia sp.]
MESKRGFTSRIGFIMSMAAFCIGIGNLWKFPYVVGNNGGGAFLIVYLIMVVLLGIPAFLIEVTLGRSAQLAPIAGMCRLEEKKSTPWSLIGWFGAFAIFVIDSFAIMIVGGWGGGYIVKVFSGSMQGMNADEIAGVFGEFAGSGACMAYSIIAAVLLWLCLNSGVKKGVEKVCSILLPTLLVIMICLAVYANTLPGASKGLLWYITPDFSKIDFSVISAAATQVFFSIGVGMCCAFVYGSYLSKDTNLVKTLSLTAILDTFVAVLAGLLIVPALFSYGIEPTAGPSLIFITLPHLFNEMGSFGNIFGGLFMICVYFAGFTSILGGSESLVANLGDKMGMSRKKASTIIVIAEFLFSLVFTMSFGDGPVAQFKALGLGFFDFMDFLAEGLGLTIGAILMLAYIIFRWGFKKFQEEANVGASGAFRIHNWMKPYFYIVLPIILLIASYCIIRMYI